MKKISVFLIMVVFMASCGSPLVHDGKTYKTMGIAHFATDKQDKCVEYDFSIGNIIWGVLTSATIIGPLYFWGFSSMNPVSVDENCLYHSENK